MIKGEIMKPKIVCLCGSTKFKEAFFLANFNETMAGKIVLSVGFFMHNEQYPVSGKQKEDLDELHKRKIDLADEILVINLGNYIGLSTASEIEYAKKLNKSIRYMF